MKQQTFATCINRMDGRTQLPVAAFMKKRFKVNYVDMITEPGPDKILAQNKDTATIASIKRRVTISVEKHHSKGIVIVGHFDCVCNPVSAGQHREDIKNAVKRVCSWGFTIPVLGVWVNKQICVKEITGGT